MSRVSYDISVTRGDSWPDGPNGEMLFLIEAQETVGGPYLPLPLDDLVYSAAQVKRRFTDTTPVAVLELDVKDQLSQPGYVGLRLPAGQSALLGLTEHYWDLELAWDADNVMTPLAGRVLVNGGVTPTVIP